MAGRWPTEYGEHPVRAQADRGRIARHRRRVLVEVRARGGGHRHPCSWILITAFLRPSARQIGAAFKTTFQQMWGALLVGPFIFGLAYVYSYSGMGNSLAHRFSSAGTAFIVLAPILGWIAVALSGSNTSAAALFGGIQASVARLLGAPPFLFPSLNSVGAETGKPVAPQTASVGVSTSRFVRKEGVVIRHNLGWTLVTLLWLIAIGCLCYFVLPSAMRAG
jgi:lactate permease